MILIVFKFARVRLGEDFKSQGLKAPGFFGLAKLDKRNFAWANALSLLDVLFAFRIKKLPQRKKSIRCGQFFTICSKGLG